MRSKPFDSSIIATMFTRSLERRRQTPASAPGLFGRRRESSVRIMGRESIRDRPPLRVSKKQKPRGKSIAEPLWHDGPEIGSRGVRGSGVRASASLRENLDDDAAVLRAAFLGLVRRDRLLFAVADHVHLVQRNLVLLVEIPFD